jgi:fumarate hydratase subunit alpha
MREIQAAGITSTVARLFEHSCHYLPEDVLIALKQAREKEKSPVCSSVLDRILENVEIAGNEQIPLCQDNGAAVVMLEATPIIDSDVKIMGTNDYGETANSDIVVIT